MYRNFLPPSPVSPAYTEEDKGEDLNHQEHSFRTLLLDHQSMVYSLALRITGDPSLAEEVAEHVFLDLHARLSDAQPPDPILQWLRTATVRRALERAADFRPPQRPANRGDQPESTPGDPFLSRHLRHLVAALPVTPRTVIALRFQEDRSPEEIAEILDLPAATVKSHLRRTLRLLHARADRLLKGVSR